MLNLKFTSIQESKVNKSLLPPVIIFLFILLVSLFFLKPKIVSIAKFKRELNANKKTLAELTKKLTVLEGLSKPELTDKVILSLKVLPAEKDVATAIFVLKKMTSNNGLAIDSLSIPEVGEIATASAEAKITDKKEILPSLVIKLNTFGEREKVVKFLKEIPITAPLMRVNSLKISQGEGFDEAEVELNYYFLSLPKTLGKPEQAINPITPNEEKVFNKINEFILTETIEGQEEAVPLGKENLFTY